MPGDEWDISTTVCETGKGTLEFLISHGNHAPCDLNEVFKKLGADSWKLTEQGDRLKEQPPLLKGFFLKLKLEAVEYELKPLPLAHAREVYLFQSHPLKLISEKCRA